MRTVPGLLDVNSDLQIASPLVTLDIDRDRASAFGVTADQMENALYDAYGARQVSTIYTSVDTYYVIMELLPKFQLDPSRLGLLYIQLFERPPGPDLHRVEASHRPSAP